MYRLPDGCGGDEVQLRFGGNALLSCLSTTKVGYCEFPLKALDQGIFIAGEASKLPTMPSSPKIGEGHADPLFEIPASSEYEASLRDLAESGKDYGFC